MTEFSQAAVPAGARGLPGRFYTRPEVYAAEQERIFAGGWVCAGRAAEIEQPGDYRTIELAGESLILLRGDEAGAPRAFYNVCRHRGARLCMEERGRFGRTIQCPYHGWTYGLDGQLRTARCMAGVEDFDAGDYPLVEATLAQWAGFLSVNLAREPESFATWMAPLLRGRLCGRLRPWSIGSLRLAERIEYDVAANWKLVVENYSECYHCPLVHPALARLSPPDSGRNDLSEGPFLGGYMTLNSPGGSMTLSGRTERPPLPGVVGANRERVYYYAIFPNLLLSLHPDYVMAHFLWPQGVGRTRIVCEWYFDPGTMAAPGFDPSDAVEFWDLTNRQDWQVCERTQLGVGSRAFTPGPYAGAEGLLWAFDRHYLQVMEGESGLGPGREGKTVIASERLRGNGSLTQE